MAHVEIKAAAPFDDTHTNTSRQKTNANLVHIRESATGNFGILLFFLRGGGTHFEGEIERFMGRRAHQQGEEGRGRLTKFIKNQQKRKENQKREKCFVFYYFFWEKKGMKRPPTSPATWFLVLPHTGRAARQLPAALFPNKKIKYSTTDLTIDLYFLFRFFFLRAVYFVFFHSFIYFSG